MAKIHYNDHLDDALERLMNEDLSTEELEKEIRRSKALALLVEKKIEHAKLVVNASKMIVAGEIKTTHLSQDILQLPESPIKAE